MAEKETPCPECEDMEELSYCCGAKISDSGLCYECHDHAEPGDNPDCELCGGTGTIKSTT